MGCFCTKTRHPSFINDECCICFEHTKLLKLECQHAFDVVCLGSYLITNKNASLNPQCPLCRRPISYTSQSIIFDLYTQDCMSSTDTQILASKLRKYMYVNKISIKMLSEKALVPYIIVERLVCNYSHFINIQSYIQLIEFVIHEM